MDDLLIELRYVDDDTRTGPGRLAGTLLTYGQRGRFRRERFLHNALRWPDNGIPINAQHVRANIITRATPFLVGDELLIDTMLPNTVAGRDAATNVKEGILTGLSVEFLKSSIQSRMVGGIMEISGAQLVGAGLVDLAEYPGSTVEIRYSEGGVALPTAATLWL